MIHYIQGKIEKNKQGRGVMILISKELQMKQIFMNISRDIELIAVEVKGRDG